MASTYSVQWEERRAEQLATEGRKGKEGFEILPGHVCAPWVKSRTSPEVHSNVNYNSTAGNNRYLFEDALFN